ncbi:MAG: cytochrome oxidase Cu insertion factor (SCO1/SenC/PrrC family), partial [Myxococcota bacterium]
PVAGRVLRVVSPSSDRKTPTFRISITMPIFSRKKPLAVGASVPDLSLSDQNGTARSLADYRGKKIVLFFYPKDDTPG